MVSFDQWPYHIVNYTMSFFIIQGLFNYLLHIPHKITSEPELVDQYYYTDYWFTIPLDYLLILGYILVSYGAIHGLGIGDHEFAMQILVVMICTILISGSFAYYFISQPETDNFFSKIFHRSGYRLVVNDILIVTMTFVLFMVVSDRK